MDWQVLARVRLPANPSCNLQDASRLTDGLIIVVHIDAVDFLAVNRFDLRGRGESLKPRRRTPRILAGYRHQAMFDGILMNIIEPRQIRVLKGQSRVAKVVPDLSTRGLVQPVDPFAVFSWSWLSMRDRFSADSSFAGEWPTK